MSTKKICKSLIFFTAMAMSTATASAQNRQYEIDARLVALLGDGVPANDIVGQGIGGRYRLSDGWFISAALEAYKYDLERPIAILGLTQDPGIKAIDAKTDITVISAGLGRVYPMSGPSLSWFWNLGIGAGFPDAKDAAGPLANGDPFLVRTDAGTEFHLQSKFGVSWAFSNSFSVNAVARAEHHFIDLKLTEVNSGAKANVDSQSPLGMHVSISYRF